jgi:hypothetical protein
MVYLNISQLQISIKSQFQIIHPIRQVTHPSHRNGFPLFGRTLVPLDGLALQRRTFLTMGLGGLAHPEARLAGAGWLGQAGDFIVLL